MDATKLSKKLKGSILKGSKIKIETARPKAEFVAGDVEPESEKRVKKKRKRDEIPAVELSDRSVQRGWTTPGKVEKRSNKKEDKKKGDKQKIKSKYTEGKECLFKTVLPPNVAAHAQKSKGRGNETTIHEFAKREKYASFLRGPAGEKLGKGVKEFIEGKGWVDEDGEVVEVVVKRRKIHKSADVINVPKNGDKSEDETSAEGKETENQEQAVPTDAQVKDTSSDDSSDVSSTEEESKPNTKSTPAAENSDTSTSGSSSESESDSEDSSENESIPKSIESTVSTPGKPRPVSSSGLTISIPNSAIASTPVHPLEALYKKPKSGEGAAPEKPSFSFFGGDDENEDDDIVPEVHDNMPFTPFTQREFEFRGQRSAAPTPDTAHANKRFLWPKNTSKDDSDDSSQHAPSSPIRKEEKGKGKQVAEEPAKDESDFTKWFYENRGDTNRAWKKRRKTVAKEKRQRDNRKRGERAN